MAAESVVVDSCSENKRMATMVLMVSDRGDHRCDLAGGERKERERKKKERKKR